MAYLGLAFKVLFLPVRIVAFGMRLVSYIAAISMLAVIAFIVWKVGL